jgi:2-polyprenyl-3-methyl-5-hydroxy-6-metoxy-1,4-benzoquinol methylase
MGDFLNIQGKFAMAIDCYDRALFAQEDYHPALVGKGDAYVKMKEHEKAAKCFEAALKISDNDVNNSCVGVLLFDTGNFEQAAHYFLKAISLNPTNPQYHKNIAKIYFRLAKSQEALDHLYEAYKICEDEDKGYFISEMSNVMMQVHISTYTEKMREIVDVCLKAKDISHRNFSSVWYTLFITNPAYRSITALYQYKSYDEFRAHFDLSAALPLLSEDFVVYGLRLLAVQSLELEMILRNIRRYILEIVDAGRLEEFAQNIKQQDSFLALACALSEQCFLNEYVYMLSPQEQESAARLAQKIKDAGEDYQGWQDLILFAVVGAYIPLWTLGPQAVAYAHAIKKKFKSDSILSLITLQIFEPEIEQNLRKTIKTLGNITDEVSQKVRAQYEESPYPRWRYANLHADPDKSAEFRKPYDILIAGCGTGKQVLQDVMMYPNAKITAVDLSLSSICYAKRKILENNIKTVEFYHGDLLDLHKLGKQFDFVMCSGVLHHMHDPEAGLASITKCLKPGGMMDIGLYSEIARHRVVHFRKLVEENGWPADLEGIRQFREHVMTLANDDTNRSIVRSRDFYSASSCRDLIFHVQEHRYTLLQIEEMLERHGLKFFQFSFLPPMTYKAFKKYFPKPEDALDLKNWHKFEEKHTDAFAAMYQFWVCHKEDEAEIRRAPKRVNIL